MTSIIIGSLGVACQLAPAEAAVKPGNSCKKLNQVSIAAGIKYTCIKSGRKLVWNKGVSNVASKPISTPTPSATSGVDLQKAVLEWIQVPERISDPGTFLDPVESSLQDYGLNSSFVVRVTIDGKPQRDAAVTWTSDDSSGKLETFEEKSDLLGLARTWYISGKSQNQRITASIVGGNSSISVSLQSISIPKNTVGRPVVVGFAPNTSKNYDQVNVIGTVNTDPIGTYYAFANFSNFYTGFQRVVCSSWDMYAQICSDARGRFTSHEAQFSVWDGKDSQGNVIRPLVVEKSNLTKCSPFDHEGSGQMCFIAFDWLPGDQMEISIKKLGGAPSNYERLRVEGRNITSGFKTHFATIDVPGGFKLNSEFAAFNEHYLTKSTASCFDVEERSFTINKVEFVAAGQVFTPVRAYAYGNEVAPGQSLCENYGFTSTSKGLEIHSGGTSRFIDIAAALDRNGSRGRFGSILQSKIMLRDIPLGILSR